MYHPEITEENHTQKSITQHCVSCENPRGVGIDAVYIRQYVRAGYYGFAEFWISSSSGYTDIRTKLNSHILALRLEQFTTPAERKPLGVNFTARDIEDYLERFDIWCLTKSDTDDKKLTVYFLHFVRKEAYTLIKNLVHPEYPTGISYTALRKKVLQHFKPTNFVAAERARFNVSTRSHPQSVRNFVLQLQTQAAKCDYGAQLEDQQRDRLIAGLQLPELQQRLLLCPDQKFQNIRKICEQYEDVKHVTKSEEAVVLRYSKRNNSRMQTNNKSKPPTNSRAPNPLTHHFTDPDPNPMARKFGKCESCGRNHSRYSCPHRRAKCFICGKTGHIQLVCKSKKVCHLTFDPNTDVKALSEDISTLSLSVLSQNSSHLTAFYPSAVIVPTDVDIRGITGHSVPLLHDTCEVTPRYLYRLYFFGFNVGTVDYWIQSYALTANSITLLTSVNENELKQLILKCSNATGGMQIPRRLIIPFGLREPALQAFQRVHADYCGRFLGKCYALILIDLYSRWPQVFLTKSPSAEFTQQSLRKVFSLECVPTVSVTDNGTHFTAKFLEEWLKGLGYRDLFTVPRRLQSKGIAENFVRTLKSAIISLSPTTFVELDRGTDNFLMQYRNAVHSVTGKSPSLLLKSRSLRTSRDCVKATDVTFFRGNDLPPATGIVLSSTGKRMVTILDLDDLCYHRRHIDQVEFNTKGQSVNGNPAVSNTNESFMTLWYPNTTYLKNTVCEESEVSIPRRSEGLRSRPPLHYKHPHAHSRCGGCDEHD
ncbi:LOW QUALITY PROTEIN: hypothetical protein T265_13486 [Opisthorchis viverrini]|uniref:Integrase catalytic domain-containing protein n=1 Tax=Opisthorchis viverrini TaxID=6198 RepID=A0A074ZN96_OPIVI|nr:LOW QUALITY PROTEIN: hypothetical protein T265_13486 [Opisthorchis viverrini]KER28873.1 LOW QUALITY PROTEIN: hypothetical protein T265_13486 [Opisthorchis viverrini]